jgi:hypothetical protein
MFIVVVLVVSLIIALVVTSGASFAMRYYRRRFESKERRSAIVIGVAFALLLPVMYCSENLLQGRAGEITATALMIDSTNSRHRHGLTIPRWMAQKRVTPTSIVE